MNRRWAGLGFAGLVCLWLGGSLRADGRQREIPFKLYRGYTIVTHGSIGSFERLNFLVDTGAVPSIVDTRLVRRLHLAGQPEQLWVFTRDIGASRVVLPELKLGPICVQSLPVLSDDLSFIERGLGIRIDAMVGLDVLGRANFTIDYERRRIGFGETAQDSFAVDLEDEPGFAVVYLRVQGRPFRLLVDTGARDLVLFENRIRDGPLSMQILGTSAVVNLGGEVPLRRARLPHARLGAADLEDQPASLMKVTVTNPPDLDGLLGVASLGVRHIAFDFNRKLMSWER